MDKIRLDTLLVERGLLESRAQAQAAVLAGEVRVNGELADKPGARVSCAAEVEVRGAAWPYVSRGGVKLEKALDEFALDVVGCVCLDVGASTGGFTDCLLQRGARRVYALDVGYGQLHWKLRQDDRVVVYERTNARFLKPELFPERPDLATLDVSFISLTKVLPAVAGVIQPGGALVALVKPQFEAGRSQVGSGGVVRNPAVHAQVLHVLWDFGEEQGWRLEGLTVSPLRGPEGNREFWMLWRTPPAAVGSQARECRFSAVLTRDRIAEVVEDHAGKNDT
jgi:23S rRNA (cytidine1920-2'-O)/16S rRNA (cytidine1409-2'-O)-methyltransferase